MRGYKTEQTNSKLTELGKLIGNKKKMTIKMSGKNLDKQLRIAIAVAILLIASAQSATVTSRKPKNDQNCTNHLQIIDRCSSLATYSYTSPINQYPNTTIEMKASCERIVEALKCLKIHGKCLSSIARRSLNSFASARSRHSKKLCANLSDTKTVEFMKINQCVSRANKKALMVASERELISAIQMLAKNTSMKWDDRFHGACCTAANYKIKVIKDFEPECSKLKDSQDDMLNSMIGELLETACPEQKRLKDICSTLAKLDLPKEWEVVSLTGAALDLIVALADNPKA